MSENACTVFVGYTLSVTVRVLHACLQKVDIYRFEPNHGPRAGGTQVTVGGSNLDIGNGVKVFVNKQECVVTK